ncbi:TPA: helix-turn-helix domain-containing protein [Raoultella ornithinolytica]|uniref:helix-turn-helix domain-containing protein n=1 Tax=Raoultella ornithinolytica TaxID=54291 RepID=UPI000A2D5C72|nr:transcriptional repressor DicA [Raoultella ornithinolytica]
MLNNKHAPYSVNSLLICAQAALLSGTASNHDVINLLDVAQDLLSLTTHHFADDETTGIGVDLLSKEMNANNTPTLSTGQCIQLARENLDLSEADLARQLNTYSDHISDWECGITEPPASMIIPLANALSCDPLWLLTGNNPEVTE